MFGTRVPALIVKELLTLFRDPKSRLVLVMPPLLQLVIFSFAATLEVKNISLAIYNQDPGQHSQELIQRLKGSPTFTHLYFVDSVGRLQPMLDKQKVLAALHFPQNFSRDIENGLSAKVQVLLDGRRSNAAQIVNGYLARLTRGYSLEVRKNRQTEALPVKIVDRHWFNENLFYLWFTVPSLVGILAMMVSLVVTALSVARERELGTFDQLLVSPLMPVEILIGKTLPAVLIGVAEGSLIWVVGVWVFGVPFTGSAWLLLLALVVFILSVVGVGLFISALSKTQQQAILGAFVFMVPAVTLSGYASPVENMPEWLQTATWFNPLTHFLVAVKGIFLKDMPFPEVWANTWPMLLIGLFTLILAGWFFTRRLE